jgi:acyl-CoA thioester hydrolase
MIDGRFEGTTFILPIRIYYADTDLSGVVYHANYLIYMERARSEFFRQCGVKLEGLADEEPTAWALRKASLEFVRPARVNDLIEVHSMIGKFSGARLEAIQHIYREGELLVRGRVEACLMTLSGKPRRIPPETRDRLLPYVSDASLPTDG